MKRLIGKFASLAGAFLLAGTALADTWTDADENVWTFTTNKTAATVTKVALNRAKVVIPSTLADKPVISFGTIFKGQENVTRVTIPAGVTAISDQAFLNCKNLKGVTISGETLSSIGKQAFMGCYNMTSFVIPNSVKTLGQGVFSGCSAMEEVTIGDGVETLPGPTYKTGSGYSSGEYLDSLAGAPNYSLFYNCTSLKTINWGKGLKTIGNCAFLGCSALENVSIPANVSSIGCHAFYNCTSLKTVEVAGEIDSIGHRAFGNCPQLHWASFQGESMAFDAGTELFYSDKDRVTVYAAVNSTGWKGVADESGLPESGTWRGAKIVYGRPSADAANPYDFFPQNGTFVAKKTSNNYEWPAPVILTTNKYVRGAATPVREVATVVQGDPVYLHYAFNEYWRGETVSAMTNAFILAGDAEGSESLERNISSKDYGYGWGTNCVLAILQNLEPGEYTLTMNLNAARNLAETDYANNTTSIAFTVVSNGKPVEYKTVTFDANGGTCATETMNVAAGKAIGKLPKATRAEYAFLGWFTAAEGGDPVSTNTVVKADVTYFAQWTEVTATVTVEGEKAAGEYSAAIAMGGTYALTSQGMPAWVEAIELNAGSAHYTLDSSVKYQITMPVNGTGTIAMKMSANAGEARSATWTIPGANGTADIVVTISQEGENPVTTHTVTFNANGGVCTVGSKTVDDGEAVGELPTATRDDYTFLGWFTAAGEQVSETTEVTADVTYFAQWKANEPEPPQPPVKIVVKIAKPTAVTDLVYSGKGLTGISGADENLTATGDLVATNAGDYAATFALPAETDTQTFVWDDGSSNAYKVAWAIAPRDLDDESVAFDEIPSQIATGAEIKPTVTMAFGETLCVLGTDYTVAYSNNVEVGTGLAVVTGVSNFTGTATLEFAIVAPEPDKYTVTFDANGGTVAENARQVAEGDAIGELPVPEREGYDFLGWFTDEGEQAEETDLVTGNVTLRAEWEKIAEETTYTVIVGAKVSIDVGVKGCKAYGLPTGLTYDAKKGLVSGTCKKAIGETEVAFTKGDDVELYALFDVREEHDPTIACAGLSTGSFTVGVAGDAAGIPLEIEAESGVKSVTAKNLPAGMKLAQNKTTKEWVITGAPTKAGTYDKIVITLTTVAKKTVTQKFSVEVAALPVTAVGSANGFVLGGSVDDPYVGTFQFTSTEAGKLSAKIVTVAGTYSFAATAWSAVTGGVYYATMTTKKGEALALELDTAKAWNETQLTGTFKAANAKASQIEAQRNAFGKLWYFNAAGNVAEGWTLTFAESAKSCDLTVTLNADGKTVLAGALKDGPDTVSSNGKTVKATSYKVSASGYADVRVIDEGAILADFATVVSAKNGKATVKKMLTVRTNLWFDKTSHKEEAGSAAFAE